MLLHHLRQQEPKPCFTLSPNSSPPGSPSLSLDQRQRRCREVDGLRHRYIGHAHPSSLDPVKLTRPALSSPSSELHHSTSIIGTPPILSMLHHYCISGWGLSALTLVTSLCEGLPEEDTPTMPENLPNLSRC